MPNQQSTLRLLKTLLIAIAVVFSVSTANAFSPDFYVSSSVLSKGNWAKIEIKETGMQFISDAMLSNLGFKDPEKVNIYGYGGRVIPENLSSPDDLPLIPSMRVNGGLIFFGHGCVTWASNTSWTTTYRHTSHPYSDKSYYFISDCNPKREKAESLDSSQLPGGDPITIFTERLVHEQDLFMAMNTGRLMLGEDFRSSPSRTFSFNLVGNTGDAVITTAFASDPSTGSSSIVLTANGKQLPASLSDKMNSSSSKAIVTTETVKTVSNPGQNLELNIKFNPGGTVSKAGLDYIEIEYPRAITMSGSELYFYLNPNKTSEIRLEGASATTVVWDVTDPLSPKEIKGVLNGQTLSFSTKTGYKEFIAFDPQKVTRSATAVGSVKNQDIHSMESPDMLVISPQEYLSAARRLVDIHRKSDGLKLLVLTPEEIYNEFSSGKPDVSAFRKLLKMWYDRCSKRDGEYAEYCLIMSRPTFDNKMITANVRNAGYPRIPIWQSPSGDSPTTSYSTDDYIGMIDDINGIFNIGTAKIRVAVGRMPVKSLTEANMAIDKLETYLLKPDFGSWRNNVMVIADDQDSGVHLEQAENSISVMRDNGNGNDFLFEKLYLDSYEMEMTGVGAAYPAAHARLMNKINEGVAFIDYIGHANPTSWGHEFLLTWKDINNLKNTRLPFIYAATCEFLRWDDDEVSGGEIMWLNPNAGVIGMICPSREVLISANGTLNKATSQFVFMRDADGLPLSVGKIMINGKNESNTSTNKLRYGLIGDPSMRLPWPTMSVKVDAINGNDLTDDNNLPVVKARSTISLEGHIEDETGNLMNDFNGIAEIQLYDAEKVITTKGNGATGVKKDYNDRKIRLYIGRVKVKNGKWTTKISMPTEIENNFSPALLSLYAYDESGREANGACEKLYVYGYDESVPEDINGPKIIEFYLNSPSFVSGQNVAPSPTLVAKFSDESGISVSEAGIGHGITLELDGKIFYDDVAQYYTPDENDPTAGSLTYRLSGVDQGKHSLKFIVWDNANNSSSAILEFNISALWKPSIEKLTTDVNPATTNVNFIVATDGVADDMSCLLEVFDINGRKVWSGTAPSFRRTDSRVSLGWDLNDSGGCRVQSGIYLYRATVTTEAGAKVTKTRKLIVR